MGGPSREREISLRSGKNVLQALQRQGYNAVQILTDGNDDNLTRDLQGQQIDVVFNVLHGTYGEDGQVQALLQKLRIPYTGSGPEACHITMNKLNTKKVLMNAGLPVPEYEPVFTAEKVKMRAPLVIKPVSEGSSFGISIIKDPKALLPALKRTLAEFPEIFVERYIRGREVTVGIIGDGKGTRPLPILELVPKNDFYDFEAKYTPGRTSFILPAPLEPKLYAQVQDLAFQAHQAAGCRGISRVDLILDEQNRPWITEINAIPGMTDQSDLPAEAKAEGISFDELVVIILNSAHL